MAILLCFNKMIVEAEIDDPRDQFPIGMRVLAINNDPTCLFLLKKLLRRCQYHGFRATHVNRSGPPALTITNGESSSPIPQSHAHATLPSPRPPTPFGPSQPIDERPLHQNYQQRGSDLCSNSYPSMDIGCLEPNDQKSQFTTSTRLIHSSLSQEEFLGTCTSPTSFTPDCLMNVTKPGQLAINRVNEEEIVVCATNPSPKSIASKIIDQLPFSLLCKSHSLVHLFTQSPHGHPLMLQSVHPLIPSQLDCYSFSFLHTSRS